MPTDGAQQNEGQLQVATIDADISGLSPADIENRIDTDAAFAKAYMEGRIVDNGTPRVEADAAPEVIPEPAQTPAEPKETPSEEPRESIFTIKAGELPEGFDTPGKVFKSLAEKQSYIQQMQNQANTREQRIQELERQLQKEQDDRKAPVQQVTEEIDESMLFDPEYMKTQFKKLQRVDSLEKELTELRETVNLSKQQEAQKKAVSEEIKALREFQTRYPAMATKKPIDEIDAEYSNFVDGIQSITNSATQADALRFVHVYLNDKGQDGEILRNAAKKAEIFPPAEIEPYLRVLSVRQAAQEVVKIDPTTRQPRNLSLDEAFKLTFPALFVQGGKQEPAKPASQAELRVAEKEQQRIMAEKLNENAATEIPPAVSGKGETVDDLTDEQIDALFKMSPEQLRANPGKKKLLDEIYTKIGHPVLNVNGQRDALI